MAKKKKEISTLVWTKPARSDLEEVWDYLQREASPAVAYRVGDAIMDRADDLISFPRQGRIGHAYNTRELVLNGIPYILIYEIDGDNINILRVIHTARLWPQG